MEEKLIKTLRDNLWNVNIEDCHRVVCVQPHPDDMDIAIGGTVGKLSGLGSHITYVTVTDGGLGTYDENITRKELAEIRRKEQLESAKFLGVEDNYFLDFEDGGDYSPEMVRDALIPIFRKTNPDLIITVDPYADYEYHPDHIKCGHAVNMAALFYRIPGHHVKENFELIRSSQRPKAIGYAFSPSPNFFIDVDNFFEKKFEALKLYVSQSHDETINEFHEYFRIKAGFYGKKIGCEYAEDLKMLPISMLHCFPEATFI